jgi:uncharacterized protein involved in exopolysaccharide biosynthesis
MDEQKMYSILYKIIKPELKNLILNFSISFFVFISISFLIPKRFDSTLKVFPNQNESNISSLNAFAQDFGLGTSAGSNFPLAEIASSNLILDKIYYSSFENADGEVTNLSTLLKGKKIPFFNKSQKPSLEKFLIIEKFKDRLSISYDRRSNITSISVSIEDPNVAKQILDLYYLELSSYINQSINNAASYKKNFIEKRSATVQEELFSAESKLEIFLNENKFIQDSPLLRKKLNELTREISVKESAYIVLKKELEMAKIDEIKNTLKIFILEKPQVSPLKSYPSRISFSLFGSIIFIVTSFCIRKRKELKNIFDLH